jgi:glyoxylase-like metal-dependent hydrolase (beta-lactamase superfamily II)
MSGWVEAGEHVWYRRYPSFDVNVGVVAGPDGLLVVDTRSSPREASELRADLAELPGGPDAVRWIVNTHAHFDHWFGNAEFPGAAVYAQADMPRAAVESLGEQKEYLAGRGPDWAADMAALTPRFPSELVELTGTVDLGGRQVLLYHPGLGHTDHDLVVLVPDAGVLFAGDLVEESAPPSYGGGSHPMDWPETARAATGLGDPAVIVPGHGTHVDQDFCAAQAADLDTVARQIRTLWADRVPLTDAPAAGTWPWPATHLAEAITLGYAALDARE